MTEPTKIFCPSCEEETDGVISSQETDSDGYTVEVCQCYKCFEIFERIFPPKDMHIVVCTGCAAAWTFKVPEGMQVEVSLTCQCGAVTKYDSRGMEAKQNDRSQG